jgi:hypothetical protein
LKLDDLRRKVGTHPAFKNKCKLKILAEKYAVELVFCPKYHCELNPIEGLWCFQKVHIRKNTDGTFEKLVELIESTKDMFVKQNINLRLWNRFFNTINDYKNNATYEEILKKYFGIKTKANIESHRRIGSV